MSSRGVAPSTSTRSPRPRARTVFAPLSPSRVGVPEGRAVASRTWATRCHRADALRTRPSRPGASLVLSSAPGVIHRIIGRTKSGLIQILHGGVHVIHALLLARGCTTRCGAHDSSAPGRVPGWGARRRRAAVSEPRTAEPQAAPFRIRQAHASRAASAPRQRRSDRSGRRPVAMPSASCHHVTPAFPYLHAVARILADAAGMTRPA